MSDEGLTVETFIRFSSKAPIDDIMNPIKTVKHLSEKEYYIYDLGQYIQGITSLFENAVKEANDNYQEAMSNIHKIDNEFINKTHSLEDNCETAVEIPKFKERLFRKDDYEMSKEEYGNLCNILNLSCQNVNDMLVIYDAKTNLVADAQYKWSILCDAKSALQSVIEIKSKFDKLSKKF